MSELKVAYRYALAMIAVAEERNKLDEVGKDFEFLDELISKAREFYLFLKSPIVNKEKKKRTLREILESRVNEVTMKFVLLLASKGREELIPEIIRQFFRLRDERSGVLNVSTRAAVKPTDKQLQQLIQQLERATKKKIRLTTTLDPSLRGGFIVQHDDTVWDASVKHQLELLRERLVEGTI